MEIAKSEVEEKRLGDYVIMPEGVESSFSRWNCRMSQVSAWGTETWERHLILPKCLMQDFLQFVDNNEPNGWSADRPVQPTTSLNFPLSRLPNLVFPTIKSGLHVLLLENSTGLKESLGKVSFLMDRVIIGLRRTGPKSEYRPSLSVFCWISLAYGY